MLGNAAWKLAPTVPLVLFAMFQLKFAVITPALITGAFAERIRFNSYVIFLCLFCVIIYAPLAHAVPGIRRYVQSHIVGTRSRPDIPETDVDVDGIAELWYDDMAAAERAGATPEMKRLTDDGALFIGRIKSYVIEEREIIPLKA